MLNSSHIFLLPSSANTYFELVIILTSLCGQGPSELKRHTSTQQIQDMEADWVVLISHQVSVSGRDPAGDWRNAFSHSEVRDNDYNFQAGVDYASGLF